MDTLPRLKQTLDLNVSSAPQSIGVILSLSGETQLLHVFVTAYEAALWFHNSDMRCRKEPLAIWIEDEYRIVVPGNMRVFPYFVHGKGGAVYVGFVLTTDAMQLVLHNNTKTYVVVESASFVGRGQIPKLSSPAQPVKFTAGDPSPKVPIKRPHETFTTSASNTLTYLHHITTTTPTRNTSSDLPHNTTTTSASSISSDLQWVMVGADQCSSKKTPCPRVPLDLPPGWKVNRKQRKLYPNKHDTRYYSPSGIRFQSKRDVLDYLDDNQTEDEIPHHQPVTPVQAIAATTPIKTPPLLPPSITPPTTPPTTPPPSFSPPPPPLPPLPYEELFQQTFFQKALSMQLQYYREQHDLQQTCIRQQIFSHTLHSFQLSSMLDRPALLLPQSQHQPQQPQPQQQQQQQQQQPQQAQMQQPRDLPRQPQQHQQIPPLQHSQPQQSDTQPQQPQESRLGPSPSLPLLLPQSHQLQQLQSQISQQVQPFQPLPLPLTSSADYWGRIIQCPEMKWLHDHITKTSAAHSHETK